MLSEDGRLAGLDLILTVTKGYFLEDFHTDRLIESVTVTFRYYIYPETVGKVEKAVPSYQAA